MRTAFSVVAQWFRDAWSLPWSLKGPFLGVLTLLLTLVAVVAVLAFPGEGGGDGAVGGAVRVPTPSATAEPTSTASPTPTPSPSPIPDPPLPSPRPPSPPAERGLTAAEVTECESGQFGGWDDAFNLKRRGFTPFPAPLMATSDPVACKAHWLTAYDDGYSRGGNDKCRIVYDYIGVASPEEIEFCSQVLGLPTPTPKPYVANLKNPIEAIIYATYWMCCDADATLALAMDYPPLHYSDLSALPEDCGAEFDINYVWWVVQCQATNVKGCVFEGNSFECAKKYTMDPLCVSDLDPDNIYPCGHVYR